MLLNQPAYLVRTGFDSQRGVDTYEILDPAANSLLGFAAELAPGAARHRFRRTFGRNLLLTTVKVYEPTSAKPTLSLEEVPSLWHPHLVLRDDAGAELCHFRGAFAVIGGGFLVADRKGRRIGELHSPASGGQYFFTNPRGRLGIIEEKAYPAAGHTCTTLYLVAVEAVNDCGRVASALLLAAALALDIVYRDRVGDHQG